MTKKSDKRILSVIKIFLLSITLLFNCLSAGAEENNAREIIYKVDRLLRGETNRGTSEMTIITPNWERTIKLTSSQLGMEKTFVRILSPAKDAGIGFLKIKNEMWSFIPSAERVVKIPPAMMMQAWMGSDFTNDDLVKESSIVEDYEHRLLGLEKIEGEDSYKIESIPKPDAPIVWGKIIYLVRKADNMPQKVSYFNEKNELIRVLGYSQLKKMHDRIIPTYWEMESVTETKKGRKTIFKILEMEFNIPLEDIFNLNQLQKVR